MIIRDDLLNELRRLGVDASRLVSIPDKTLHRLISDIKKVMASEGAEPPTDFKIRKSRRIPRLTSLDRKILMAVMASRGKVSSLFLSRQLSVPVSTVQRRHRRLENEYLEPVVSLKLDKFGLRSAIIFISSTKGMTAKIGRELLSWNQVTKVCRMIGENMIDLVASVVFINNTELLEIMERIKSQEGVMTVFWSEVVETMGTKNTALIEILDSSGTQKSFDTK